MTTRRSVFALLLLAVPFLLSCQSFERESGVVLSESRPIDGVKHIELNLPGEMVITLGAEDSMTIEGDANIVSNIETSIDADRMTIALADADMRLDPQTDLVFDLTVTDLRRVVSNSAGNIEIAGVQSALGVEINGDGHVMASGSGESLSVQIEGSGSFDGAGLSTESAWITINSSSTARVHVTDTLDASVSGFGNIEVSGEPSVVNSTSNGFNLLPIRYVNEE